MQYRGISYQLSSQSIETAEIDIEAKFRGTSYHIRRPVNPSVQMPKHLMYRGVAYGSRSQTATGTIPAFG
jgi:Domain of unknown function (DUF4278)